MINKNIQQFPIIYTSESRRRAIGWGAHTTVADECKSINIKKALIVTTGLRGTGIVDEIKSILNYNGVSTEIFNKVTSNPKDYQVMEGLGAGQGLGFPRYFHRPREQRPNCQSALFD